MTATFTGTAADFEKDVSRLKWKGAWKKEPNGVWMRKAQNGACLHYSETKNTWWVQGKPHVKAALESSVAAASRGIQQNFTIEVSGLGNAVLIQAILDWHLSLGIAAKRTA